MTYTQENAVEIQNKLQKWDEDQKQLEILKKNIENFQWTLAYKWRSYREFIRRAAAGEPVRFDNAVSTTLNLNEEPARYKIEEPVTAVILNANYTADVTKDGVKVGCQTFTFEAIEKLAEAVKKQKTA